LHWGGNNHHLSIIIIIIIIIGSSINIITREILCVLHCLHLVGNV